MATSFGESTPASALVYTIKPVPLRQVTAGALVEHDGRVFKVFKLLRVVKPSGVVAVAVQRDAAGGWDGESVALWFYSRDDLVRLVCGAEAT
jgi:hypothetical protein